VGDACCPKDGGSGCVPHDACHEHLVYTNRLAFRPRKQIQADLRAAGLDAS
jgi:hypothetical protein